MSIVVRPAAERGHTRIDWLDSRHTFSFGGYQEPGQMGFRSLRVINDDRVREGAGFGRHPHRDMEILTYVLQGSLAHKDSLGNGSTVGPGEVQKMSAGTGILHSEFNPSESEPLRFLQVWILPSRTGLQPSYEQRTFGEADKRGRLKLIGSPDGRDGSIVLHQDVSIFASILHPGEAVEHRLGAGRGAWLQVARGSVLANERRLDEADGAAIENESTLSIRGATEAEFLLFDLA
jgi:redox-sensitive bicupin YhaK (pirin superfamily)